MNIKKYYATDMQEALRQIKEELGPDAVIISSKMVRTKQGPLKLFSRRVIEVVASYEEKDRPTRKKSYEPAKPIARPKPEVKPYAMDSAVNSYKQAGGGRRPIEPVPVTGMGLDNQIGEIKRMIEQMSSKVDGIGKDSVAQFNDETAAIYRRLIDQDVDDELAVSICERAQDISVRKGAKASEVAESLVLEELGTPVFISPTKFQRKVVMVIGPTGVGKTTTLVKLASDMIVKKELSVGIINSDVYRVGAQEQLKTYCEILGIKMYTIYKPGELDDALNELRDADVVLLDTAGKVSNDEEYQREIAELVERGNIDQIYLTISASTSVKTMRETLKNYAFLGTHNILLTKLDEVGTRGALLNASHFGKRPLSYITLGQTVPDDIAQVSTADVAHDLIG